jgi:hypothetical protein
MGRKRANVSKMYLNWMGTKQHLMKRNEYVADTLAVASPLIGYRRYLLFRCVCPDSTLSYASYALPKIPPCVIISVGTLNGAACKMPRLWVFLDPYQARRQTRRVVHWPLR